MITGQRKSFDDIKGFVEQYGKVLVAGCGSCVTVCLVGGESQMKVLASELRIAGGQEGKKKEVLEICTLRQCDPELVEPISEMVKKEKVDAVLSLACGVGVNFLAGVLAETPVFPAIDTRFMGACIEPGLWREMCAGCGSCVLHLTGGICPVVRCCKSIMNGPCGGSNEGKCEIDPETDCAWHLIVERMKRLGTLDKLDEVQAPRDWSTSSHGGPRKHIVEAVKAIEVSPVGAAEAGRGAE